MKRSAPPPLVISLGEPRRATDPDRELRLLSPAACLQEVVTFTRLDLRRLPPAGWTQLRARLADVLMGGAQRLDRAPLIVAGRDADGGTVFTCPKPILERLQVDVRGLLERLVDSRTAMGTAAGTAPVPVATLTAPPRLWLLPTAEGTTIRQVDQLPVDDALRYRLWDLLGQTVSTQLRRCPEVRCRRQLFYRVRRQKYCSTRCLSRAMKRAKRARQGETVRRKDKQRKARRQRRTQGRTS